MKTLNYDMVGDLQKENDILKKHIAELEAKLDLLQDIQRERTMLHDTIDNCREIIERLTPRWIWDALPEKDGNYPVVVRMSNGILQQGKLWFRNGKWRTYAHVVAWLYMPDEPKFEEVK